MIKSLVTLNGDFLEKILIPELKDLFAPFALNSSGELDNKTGINFKWPAKNQIKKDSCLDFYYDWRLDPLETADELSRFIDSKEKKLLSMLEKSLVRRTRFHQRK